MEKESLKVFDEFKKEWFPARKPPTFEDFINWLEKTGYQFIKLERFDRK